MSDLLQILSTAATSLAAQRAATATAAHNLQNANTPGYARQRATIQATLPSERVGDSWIGRGALLGQITQSRDRFLEAQIPALLGNAARSSAASETLAAVSVLDPEAPGGLGDALSGFYAALRQLSQNGSDSGLRQSAVAAARTLALSFNTSRDALEDARSGADAKLAAAVQDVNDLARSVATLNEQVRAARAGGMGEPNDLLDARQKAVDELAALTGASPVPTSEGDVSLFLPGGQALVSGMQAGTMSAVARADGHLTLQLALGGPSAPSSPGGQLGGLLDARDGALADAVGSLDQLAWELAAAVNAIHRAGQGVDAARTTGLDLFDAGATQAGAASRLAVNAQIQGDPRLLAAGRAPNGAGDGSNALLLVDTEQAALPGGFSPASWLSDVTSQFGASARSLAALASQDAGLRDHLSTMRESVSGVSIDDELIEMQKAQRAFEAISKVIQTSSEMFDTLMQLK